jgi:hypothetical protein
MARVFEWSKIMSTRVEMKVLEMMMMMMMKAYMVMSETMMPMELYDEELSHQWWGILDELEGK